MIFTWDSDIKRENKRIQQTLNWRLGKVKLGLIYASDYLIIAFGLD